MVPPVLRVIQAQSSLALSQINDPELQKVYKAVQRGLTEDDAIDTTEDPQLTKSLAKMIDVHVLSLSQDGVLVATLPVNNRKRGVAICPAKYQKELMYENHRITHLGVRNTTQRIQLDW